MSFSTQDPKKKFSIYRQALKAYEASLGVWIQRVPSAYLVRLMKSDADASDPVVRALRELDTHFPYCSQQDVEMTGCVESIILEHAEDSKGGGCVLIAWAQDHPGAPKPVGLVTLHDFIRSDNFKTTDTYFGTNDSATLTPYFGSRWVYIDCMCSTRRGVGRLLLASSIKYAISRKKMGVIALAYATRANQTPQSAAAFDKCNFEKLIPRANYRVQMYGTWYKLDLRNLTLAGIDERAVAVCTRTGLTAQTQDRLIWRCPA